MLLVVLVVVGLIVLIVKATKRGRETTVIISGQAAGWYPDPSDDQLLRYWDGTQWTGDTAQKDSSTS